MHTQVFYDGDCGLCHRSVRFLLGRDADGTLFRFAPLYGPTFETFVPSAERAALPNSLVVRTPEGRLLSRSAGVFFALKQLGGFWAAVGTVGGWLPGRLADWAYDRVAAVRKRLFARPAERCPVVSVELRSRFDP